jgi:hypothetical protein
MGSRTEKFPFRNALRAARSWRPLRVVGLIAVRLPIDVSQPLSPNWSPAGRARGFRRGGFISAIAFARSRWR